MKGDIFKAAIIGGLFTGVLSGLPGINFLNCLCCMWVILGGILAGYLYQRDSTVKLEIGDGFAVGGLSGAAGAVIAAPLTIAFSALTRAWVLNLLSNFMEQYGGGVDISQLEAQMRATSLSMTMVRIVIDIVIFAVFGAIGGAIATLIFKPQKPSSEVSLEAKTGSDSQSSL